MDRFSVSVKGVLELGGQYLLRKNERTEYELLGGRLEKTDSSAAERLVTEFSEESGIKVQVCSQLEPWLYEIGLKNIIIVPYVCKALSVPDQLVDEDGGTLHWIQAKDIQSCFMPQGYKDTIDAIIPHKSYSIPANFFFKVIPNYVERDYYIEICVMERAVEVLHAPLVHFHSPRDFIFSRLGSEYKNAQLLSMPIGIDHDRDTVILNYIIN